MPVNCVTIVQNRKKDSFNNIFLKSNGRQILFLNCTDNPFSGLVFDKMSNNVDLK